MQGSYQRGINNNILHIYVSFKRYMSTYNINKKTK